MHRQTSMIKDTINEIKDGETYQHTGNLVIAGNVGKGAKVCIHDGALIIQGTVCAGATIEATTLKKNIEEQSYSNLFILVHKGITSKPQPSLKLAYEYEVVINGAILDDVTLTSSASIAIQGDIGKNCTLTSAYGSIAVCNIGENTNIHAKKYVSCKNVSDGCSLVSEEGYVVEGACIGNNVTIKAKKHIQVQDVGDFCHLESDEGEIRAKRVGNNVKLLAKQSSIRLNYIAANSSVQSQYFYADMVEPGIKMDVPPKNITIYVYATYNPSQQPSLSYTDQDSTTISDTKKIEKKNEHRPVDLQEDDIPNGYCCEISREIMKDPVLCTLDYRTYERAQIEEWLRKHQTAPFNREPLVLQENETIEEAIQRVLQRQRSLQSAIEEYVAQMKKISPSENKSAFGMRI